MTHVTFIRGIPGTGKSTLAQKMKSNFTSEFISCAIIEADDFFLIPHGFPGAESYNFEGSMIPHAHELAQAKFRYWIYHQVPQIIVANTMCQQWELDKYLGIMESMRPGAPTFGIVNMEIEYGSVHGVPEDRMKMFRKKYVPHLKVTSWKYPTCEDYKTYA